MRSFRASLARRVAIGSFVLFLLVVASCTLALRSILYRQLDGTLLYLAEVEAQAGAATTGPEFQFHEGVLLSAREGSAAELTRYAQLWTSDGRPLVRSRNLSHNLQLPKAAFAEAQRGTVAWNTHVWRGKKLRCVIYPLKLVGAAHGVHVLQVAAPVEPVERTVSEFMLLAGIWTILATGGAYAVGWRIAGIALRPTQEITAKAEAVEAGTISEPITAHANVEEFRRLVAVLNAMLERLDQAFQVQRRFTADASHELRAPLTALRGDIELALKRERTTEEYRQTLERSREEVISLSKLANDLLILARTEAGLVQEHLQEVDLRELAARVGSRFRTIAGAKNIHIDVRGSEVVVRGDPGVLERIVINLVDNAVKYTPEGGRISLEVIADAEAQLVVRDTGPGIAPEHVPRLFERFFRADPARPRSDGAGLGLAIAHAGAVAHGGRLELAGSGPGTAFRLSLPPETIVRST